MIDPFLEFRALKEPKTGSFVSRSLRVAKAAIVVVVLDLLQESDSVAFRNNVIRLSPVVVPWPLVYYLLP